MSKPMKPRPHPYDAARAQLKENGGGLFGVKFWEFYYATPAAMNRAAMPTKWQIRKLGFPGSRYARILYDSGHVVNVPDESDEELERMAQVFMDLICSK